MAAVTYRNQIYEIFSDPNEALENQIEQALYIGTEYLDLSIGFLHGYQEGRRRLFRRPGITR